MTDYRVSNLTSLFLSHAEEIEKDRIEAINDHEEDCEPHEDLPEYLSDDFNIAKALSVICWEIERLKNILGVK